MTSWPAGESGDGFPFEITGSSVIGMESTRDGLALLTNNSLVLLNSKGGGDLQAAARFFKAHERAGGRWILVADSGGNRLRARKPAVHGGRDDG